MPLHTPLGSLDLSLTHLCNEVSNSDLPKLEHQVIKPGAGGERVLSDSKGRGLGDSGHTIIILHSTPHPTLCPLNMHRASALIWAQIWAEGC